MTALAARLAPCGPVMDPPAAERVREALSGAAREGEWSAVLERAWPALAPVAAASPYLASLMRTAPDRLRACLETDPQTHLAGLLSATAGCGADSIERAEARLRRLKKDVHLLTALCDLGGVWDLDAATGALTRFADAALVAAFEIAGAEAAGQGRLRPGPHGHGPLPGLFCLAMGKLGACELNYSSDIDLVFFFDPDALPLAQMDESAAFATRFAERVAGLLQRRTVEGYVFRVDTRLRPDPASTPTAVSLPAAFNYYESVGQNWERAAFIKARPVAGDLARAHAFLDQLHPFIWRRNLDFAAIADIHSIKRQIHVHKVDDRLSAKGADLKLGRGGIREIEFFVQTQQLILGGRHPELRAPRTLDALAALAGTGRVAPAAAEILAGAYARLRALEHRAQMVADEQTHRLPENDADRRRIAALAGFADLRRFDAETSRLLRSVNRLYAGLFAGEETLASRFGSLVFTGSEDDPETLATLRRMGFAEPGRPCATLRAWHHGTIGPTRSERGRELLTRLAPRLLEAAQATGAPDVAFARFAQFFAALTSGVQVQSLFLARPELLGLVVKVMAIAPRLARTLARRPEALDALLDPAFFTPIATGGRGALSAVRAAGGFEAAMEVARRRFRESQFRIGVQVLGGVLAPGDAGAVFTDLADDLIDGLARAALEEVERLAGAFPGEVAVIALGKCGSREMTATSDLDLMTLYRPSAPDAVSGLKGWSAETFYARFTQRLVSALSAPTAEGGLYEVDLRLRPSGTQGPVAVSLAAFETYHAGAAETWEHLAITRARLVWATSDDFATVATEAVLAALRQPRDMAAAAADARDMRELMERERPAQGFWDMKLNPGALVDIEFCAEFLQLAGAAAGGPLVHNTGAALQVLAAAWPAHAARLKVLASAWALQQDLSQVLRIALEEDADPSQEPTALRDLLARVGGVSRFADLARRVERRREAARAAFQALIPR